MKKIALWGAAFTLMSSYAAYADSFYIGIGTPAPAYVVAPPPPPPAYVVQPAPVYYYHDRHHYYDWRYWHEHREHERHEHGDRD